MAYFERRDQLPLPPKNAQVKNTVCQYCTVGCGYRVYVWPVGQEGGLKASENAFGVDFTAPQDPITGFAYTETMHSVITQNFQQFNVAIVPAKDSSINLYGDHSSRGASNALTLFSERRGTRERLQYPLLRVGDQFQAIPWEEALELLALLVHQVQEQHGADQLTAKAFDHGGGGGGFENNYAIGKLFFSALNMQHVAIHNRPAYNSEVWGSRDRGLHELNYTAEDAQLCDTLVLWGANPYETASVFYTEHMLPNFMGLTAESKQNTFKSENLEPNRVVVIDPRRTSSLTVLESIDAERVLHLRPNLGTDYVLANAIARIAHGQGWHDQAFINERTDLGTWQDYAQKSLQLSRSLDDVLQEAEKLTGVAVSDMRKAAQWIFSRKGSALRRSLIIYEKGMIWNVKNYDQIAALAQLAVLGHHVGRPGTGCGRLGGHQEGYVRPPYPGVRPPPNVDEMLVQGKGKLYWVIGTNPYLSTPNNQTFRKAIHRRTRTLTDSLGKSGEPADVKSWVQKALQAFQSTDALFMVVQDLYLTDTARDAHLVLPAAGWGEMNLTSINCNSRLLRLYEQFMEAPGEAKPDWQILSLFAKALQQHIPAGTPAFAALQEMTGWTSDEDVFQAGAKEFKDNRIPASEESTLEAENYKGVTYAELRKLGQQGIQTPVRQDPLSGKVQGTVRRYAEKFATSDGKFKWYGTDPWTGYPEQVAKYLTPQKEALYPFWMTTGRNQTLWQTGYHDQHLPEKMTTVPLPYVEIHPMDAQRLGLRSGDIAEVFNEEGNGTFQVRVTDAVKEGLVFVLQFHPRGTSNSMVSGYTDPKTTIPWYKGTRVGLRKANGQLSKLQRSTSFLDTHDFQ